MKRLPKLKLGQPVMVFWNDTVGYECSWFEPKEVSTMNIDRGLIVTLGFVVEVKREKCLFIAHSKDLQKDLYSALCKIPIACIEALKKL